VGLPYGARLRLVDALARSGRSGGASPAASVGADGAVTRDNSGDRGTTGSLEGDLIAAIKAFPGAVIDARQEVREGPTGVRGVFATAHIAKDEVLLVIPRQALLVGPRGGGGGEGAGAPSRRNPQLCALVEELRLDMEGLSGAASSRNLTSVRRAYVALLMAVPAAFPTAWDIRDRRALQRALPNLLPDDFDVRVNFWKDMCGGDPVGKPLGRQAYQMVVTRAAAVDNDAALVPWMDLYNHHNDAHSMNLRTGLFLKRMPDEGRTEEGLHKTIADIAKGDAYMVMANRDVQAGEELCHSYSNLQTPDIFRDWGFVEDLPQHWWVPTGGRAEERLAWMVSACEPKSEVAVRGFCRGGVVVSWPTDREEGSGKVKAAQVVLPAAEARAAVAHLDRAIAALKAPTAAAAAAAASPGSKQTILGYRTKVMEAMQLARTSALRDMRIAGGN